MRFSMIITTTLWFFWTSSFVVVTDAADDDDAHYNGLVWLVCGDSADQLCVQKQGASEIIASTNEKHEVRCCSDKDLEGWSKIAGCHVWAASYVGSIAGKCYPQEHFAQAQQLCWESGGRLCTREEVLQRCTVGTGCHQEGSLIWTSTLAGNEHHPVQEGKWVVKGIGTEAKLELNIDGSLFQSAAKYPYRCCSNVALPGAWSNKPRMGTSSKTACQVYSTTPEDCPTTSYKSASDNCASLGGRLCTKEEIFMGCTLLTGCNFDHAFLWSDSTGYALVDSTDTDSTAEEEGNGSHSDIIQATGGLEHSSSANNNNIPNLIWTVCGDVTNQECFLRESATEVVSATVADEKHKVQCCSDVELPGWTKNYGCSVWAESELQGPDGSQKCFHSETFLEAQEICHDNGGRLCTREELYQRCTVGTGCTHEDDLIWTSTIVDQSTLTAEGYWAAKGFGNVTKLEFDTRVEHPFRCCSDRALPNWYKLRDNCNVHAISDLTPGGCQSGAWVVAHKICQTVGGRLCSKDEIMRGCTIGTGCDYDQFFLWTGTKGYLSSDTVVQSVVGSSSSSSQPLGGSSSSSSALDTSTPQLFWAVCRDITNTVCLSKQSAIEVVSEASQYKHTVTCCSDTRIRNWKKAKGCHVWAQSKLNDKCYPSESLFAAQAICAQHGGRLCTRQELLQRCTVATGCNHESELVWTGTPAQGVVREGYWAVTGYGTEAKLELDPAAKNHFRCCSDQALPGWPQLRENCNVYAVSETPNCQSGIWQIAKDSCAAVGGRLCTKQELMMGCTIGTGCTFDHFFLWSGTMGYLPEEDQTPIVGVIEEVDRPTTSSSSVPAPSKPTATKPTPSFGEVIAPGVTLPPVKPPLFKSDATAIFLSRRTVLGCFAATVLVFGIA